MQAPPQGGTAPAAPDFWDPFEGRMALQAFDADAADLERRFRKLAARPGRPRLYALLLGALMPVGLGIDIYRFGFLAVEPDIPSTVLALIPFALYCRHVSNLQRDLLKQLVARENGWLYDPGERAERWEVARRRFPALLDLGSRDRNLQDSFWGRMAVRGRPVDFHIAIFHYATVSRDKDGNERKTSHYETVFFVHLWKALPATLRLTPEGLHHRLFDALGGRDLETESVAFNKAFRVKGEGDALQLRRMLAPAVQELLVDLQRRRGDFEAEFSGDSAAFKFDGVMMRGLGLSTLLGFGSRDPQSPNYRMQTNFFRGIALASSDKVFIEGRIRELVQIAGEMARFLD